MAPEELEPSVGADQASPSTGDPIPHSDAGLPANPSAPLVANGREQQAVQKSPGEGHPSGDSTTKKSGKSVTDCSSDGAKSHHRHLHWLEHVRICPMCRQDAIFAYESDIARLLELDPK
jgi:hypothetical protein